MSKIRDLSEELWNGTLDTSESHPVHTRYPEGDEVLDGVLYYKGIAGATTVDSGDGLVMLDTKHRMLRVRIVSIGCLDSTVVHPREVFREAAAASAASIILFHNHPSGDPHPSEDDVRLTTRMLQAGDVMGIAVIDHVILADQRYFSMTEAGLLPPFAG